MKGILKRNAKEDKLKDSKMNKIKPKESRLIKENMGN